VSLVKSAGWARLGKIIDAQVEMRERRILAEDLDTKDQVAEVRKLKEERKALKLVMQLPETIIEGIDEELSDVEETE